MSADMSGPPQRIEAIKRNERCRHWSAEQKQAIVEAKPGAERLYHGVRAQVWYRNRLSL